MARARIAKAKDPEFCCEPARGSMFLRHAAHCRVFLPDDHPARLAEKKRRKAQSGHREDDHHQGDGCEGGKCVVRP